jgi:uncharacterized delta-60 repeat protein
VAPRSKATCRLGVEYLEARDNPSGGTLDPTFGSGGIVTSSFVTGTNIATDALVQPDGKVVTVGYVTGVGKNAGTNDFFVARYTANGTLDSAFGTGGRTITNILREGNDVPLAVALQPGTGGKILAAGWSSGYASNSPKSHETDFALVRYNANGTVDTTFGNKGVVTTNAGQGYAMAVQPDGRIIVAGINRSGTSSKLALVRYTATGALDTTFGSGGKLLTSFETYTDGYSNLSLTVLADGRIVVAGTTPPVTTAAEYDFQVIRFNSNGTLDTSFGGGAGWVRTDFNGRLDRAHGLAIQPDGGIVVAGFSVQGGEGKAALARYNSDGTLDASFGSGGTVLAPCPPSSTSSGSTTWPSRGTGRSSSPVPSESRRM